MAKTKKYVTEDGMYIAIDERDEGFYLAWYIPEDGDFGAYLGENTGKYGPPYKCNEHREVGISESIVASFAMDKEDYIGVTSRGYCFERSKDSKECLRMINEALLSGEDNPWPDWAKKASEAGWIPPVGWNP
jgi:hypothetical protein